MDADLREADLTGANLTGVDFSNADLRRAIVADADLTKSTLTGAKIHGLDTGGDFPEDISVEWADAGPKADGRHLLDIRQVRRMLAAPEASPSGKQRRFFGQGDVLRNAELDFREGATVHIESAFENCAIHLSADSELVLGDKGSMKDCTISGGRLTIHGRFEQGEQPGLVEPQRLVVSSTGVVASTLKQPQAPTEFAFERGCRLRIEIQKPAGNQGA